MQVNWPVAIGIISYNILVIILVYIWLSIRAKTHNEATDFILSGRNLPWYVVAATQALTCLGGGHIMGLTGQSWSTGIPTIWYCLAHGIMMFLILCYVGPWFRRMGFVTVNQMFEVFFSPVVRPILVGVGVGTCWAILSLETQGLGAIVAAVTGLQVWQGAIIGGVIGILYVVLAGMKEVGYVNLINAILMYVGAILTLFFIGNELPGGWAGVNQHFIDAGESHLLTLFGSYDIIKVYVIGTLIACLFYNPIVQQCAQVGAAVKDVNTLRKSAMLAIPLNVMFGVIVIALGMAARSVPELAAMSDGGSAVFAMCIQYLPTWLCIWIIGVFLAAILSTFAMLSLAASTMLLKDVHQEYFREEPMNAKEESTYSRIYILIIACSAIAVAAFLPPVTAAITWVFSWMTPVFFMFVIGMHYKRSTKACIATWVLCWIINIILSVTDIMTILKINGNNYAIVMMIFALIFGFLFTALDKNAKPPFKKLYAEQRAAWEAARHAKAAVKPGPTT